MATEPLNLHEAVIFLAAAGLVVPLMQRLKVSPVLGFLAVGLVIGPFGLGRLIPDVPTLGLIVIEDAARVRTLAELGVVFLLFMIGLELSFDRLWSMRTLVFGLGGAQVVVTAAVIGASAYFFGNSPAAALVLGACLALSSTAIVMQLLTERGQLGSPVGRTSFAVLLFQDLAVVPILFLVSALGIRSEGPIYIELAIAIGKAALSIAVIFVIGRLLLRPALRFVSATGSRELFLAAVLLVVIGTALGAQAAGLSLALGAFLGGLLLAETEYRHQVAVDLEPFKGLLLGLFFVSVGLGIDLAGVLADPLWIPLSVVGLIVAKAIILYLLARAFGERRAVAAESAILLGQGGEFVFIVLGLAASFNLVPSATVQFILIVTGITMVLTPALAIVAKRVASRIAEPDAATAIGEISMDLDGHVVIAGYGRVGRMVGSLLDSQQIDHVAVDLDAGAVAEWRAQGVAVFYGDASRHEILHRLGIGRAASVVVTMDSATAAENIVAAIRRDWPHLPIYARVRDAAHARRLVAAGATHVIPETVEASLELGEAVLIGVGVPDEAARRIVADRREREKAALIFGPNK